MDNRDLLPRHRAGLDITREAGAFALDYYRRRASLPIERKGLQDFVSVADKETEELIVGKLSALFPDDSFLGEEGGLRQKGPLLWVIDPIDGTANFLRGIHHWCVSVGLIADGKSVLGFIYDPVMDEMFSAFAGGGAFLNGERIKVSGVTDLGEARDQRRLQLPAACRAACQDVEALLDCRQRIQPPWLRRARPCLHRGGTFRRLLRAPHQPLGRGRRPRDRR